MTVRTNGARTSRVGSSINTGVLQIQGGVPIDSTLRQITDQLGTVTPIQVSTTNIQLGYGVAIGGAPTTDGLKVYGQAGKTAMSLVGTAATMYIDLNGTGRNFFDSEETRFRNKAGLSIAMNIWGELGKIAIGGLATNYTPSAVLQVRGNGTDPIFMAENSAGTAGLLVNNDLSINTGGALTVLTSITGAYGSYTLDFANPYVRTSVASTSAYGGFQVFNNGNITRTTGETSTMAIAGLFSAGAGSANYKPLSITYTINNSGAQTGIATGIFLNATETALNGMTHNLMDLQVGGVSKFRVDKNGGAALSSITSNNWLMQFTDNGTGFLLLKGSNRFKVSALGVMAAIGGAAIGYDTLTVSARLQVRGDNTNPIARFENLAGIARFIIHDNGRVNISSLPTSSSGLSSGDIWNNSGVLNIIP